MYKNPLQPGPAYLHESRESFIWVDKAGLRHNNIQKLKLKFKTHTRHFSYSDSALLLIRMLTSADLVIGGGSIASENIFCLAITAPSTPRQITEHLDFVRRVLPLLGIKKPARFLWLRDSCEYLLSLENYHQGAVLHWAVVEHHEDFYKIIFSPLYWLYHTTPYIIPYRSTWSAGVLLKHWNYWNVFPSKISRR